jgi:hypothetical protein
MPPAQTPPAGSPELPGGLGDLFSGGPATGTLPVQAVPVAPSAPAAPAGPGPGHDDDDDAEDRRDGRLRRALGAGVLWLAVYALVAVGGLLRVDGVRPWRSLWAEDGSRFLMTAVERPGIRTWAEPFAGYRHLIPRMIGDVASRFPLVHAATIFAVLSMAVAAAALILFAIGLRRWLPSIWMRAGLVLAVAMTHAMGSEVAANAANLHWYLTLGLIGLALLRPHGVTTALAGAAVALAFALSDPFAIAVALLAIGDAAWRTWSRRLPAREAFAAWPIALAITLGGAVQLQTMVTHPRTPSPWPEIGWYDILPEYVGWVLRGGLSPRALASVPDDTLLLAAAGLAAALLAIAVAVGAARRRIGSHPVIGVGMIAASPAIFLVNASVNHRIGDRYAAVPVALLVTGILVLAAGVGRIGPGLFAVGCVALIGLGAASFPTTPQRSVGPDYVSQVEQAARSECSSMMDIVGIPIAPGHRGRDGEAQWQVRLPCSRLEHGQFEPSWL